MRQFYLMIEKGATMWHQLTWSHYRLLLPLDSIECINYYLKTAAINLYSVRQLETIIKNNEYEKLSDEYKNKLKEKEKIQLKDIVKEPITIMNRGNYELISEKILQKLILEDIPSFLKELGEGFSFIDNEYRIKIGDNYNYIDILLYNLKFRCYVVVELKVVKLSKDHIGQIEVYMNYIDRNIRNDLDNNTIGIILVRRNNKYIMEYCSDKRIISKEYLLLNDL